MTINRHKIKSLQNRLCELNNIISTLEGANREVKDKILQINNDRLQKTYDLQKLVNECKLKIEEIKGIKNQINYSTASSYYVDLIQAKINNMTEMQNTIQTMRNEIQSLDNQILTLKNNNESGCYNALIYEREQVKKELMDMDKNEEFQQSSMCTYEYNHESKGRALIKTNLIDNILKHIKTEKFDQYCRKYNLLVNEIETRNKITILSKDKNISIIVEKNRISATCKNTDTLFIDALIDLYFIGLENNQNIYNHSITHNDSSIVKIAETKLADRLKKVNILDQKINGKSLDDILNQKSLINDSEQIVTDQTNETLTPKLR